jgi:hypothetical protein
MWWIIGIGAAFFLYQLSARRPVPAVLAPAAQPRARALRALYSAQAPCRNRGGRRSRNVGKVQFGPHADNGSSWTTCAHFLMIHTVRTWQPVFLRSIQATRAGMTAAWEKPWPATARRIDLVVARRNRSWCRDPAVRDRRPEMSPTDKPGRGRHAQCPGAHGIGSEDGAAHLHRRPHDRGERPRNERRSR